MYVRHSANISVQYMQYRKERNKYICLESVTEFSLVLKLKVIPHICIADLFCTQFMASLSLPSCTSILKKSWQICLDIELCYLKSGYIYSSPKSKIQCALFDFVV